MKPSEATRCMSLPVGAEVQTAGGTHFRVWAPLSKSVAVDFHNSPETVALRPERDGYFSGIVRQASAGWRYKLQLDGAEAFPDPASRFQPSGPHGYSEVIDPSAFGWTDKNWRGVRIKGQVVYEMHVGTFTRAGTWSSAAEKLDYLKDTGITVIEVMPVSDFPGKFGWGYDGVDMFAPSRLYGTPDDFRRFVDRAHALGVGMILDVVYNHLGPDGNYLRAFAEEYFTDRYKTEWGAAINYDGEKSEHVRAFILANARHWIEEYHLDGFRLDATQS